MIGPLKKLVLTEDGETKPAAAVAVVLVLVISCAALGYYFWQGGVDLGGGEPQLRIPMKCYSCGHIGFEKLAVGEQSFICPKCGKPTYVPAHKCEKCGTFEVLNENRGLAPPTKCPKCGTEMRHGS